MPVTSITQDAEALTLTIDAEFATPVQRLWDAHTDPAQLNRFWGPPGWPATFQPFTVQPGSIAHFAMTGPRGEQSRGRWEFLEINEPHGFTVLDGFADENGELSTEIDPMRITFTFEATPTGTHMRTITQFSSLESLEQIVAMGVEEGTRSAMNQLDTVLQDLREHAAGRGTEVEILDDQRIRITRAVNGPRDLVWRAHHEPDLIRQWMLGPDGWSMTTCEVNLAGTYRYAWSKDDGAAEPFGFEGRFLVVNAPERAVSTESFSGAPGVESINDLQLYEEDGITLITTIIEYPNAQVRDEVLATGMVDGMEASYARLERVVL